MSQIFYKAIEQNRQYIWDENEQQEISDQRKKKKKKSCTETQPKLNFQKNKKLFCAGINFLFSDPKCLKIFSG